MYVLQNNNK